MERFSTFLNEYLEEKHNSDWLNLRRLRNIDLGFQDLNDKYNCLRSLYKRITGSDYVLLPCITELQASDILILVLLHFRYMTSEQFSLLFPYHGKNLLSSLKSYKSKYFGSSYFITSLYDGKKCVYSLTSSVFDSYCDLFPEEYKEVVNFGTYSKPSSKSSLGHDVIMCDVPYSCLSSKFSEPLRWFCYIPLVAGQNPAAVVSMFMKQKKDFVMNESNNTVPDAIMLFDESSVIVEQDMCTERIARIISKFESYGNYFASLNEPLANTQLLFNISALYGPNDKSKSGYHLHGNATFKNIQLVANTINNQNLQAVYETLQSSYQQKQDKSTKNMMSLIIKYFPEENVRYGKKVDALLEKLEALKKQNQAEELSEHDNRIRNRAGDISNGFFKFRDGNSPASYNFFAAIKKGLSLVVTSEYQKYCRYINLFESGVIDEFVGIIKDKYANMALTPYAVRGLPLTIAQAPTVIRNCIAFKRPDNKNHPLLYVLSEITFDIGERIRISDLLYCYNGSNVELHLVFLVRDSQSAIRFCQETKCIEKYCQEDTPLLSNSTYNVYIRFYSMDEQNFFVVSQFEKVYKIGGKEL